MRIEHAPGDPQDGAAVVVKFWVYYNPSAGEAVIYENEPPESFGRRQYDIGPIDVNEAVITDYEKAKSTWHTAHAEFVSAVKAARDSELIDGSNA